jgi:hypothetical protein
MVIHRVEREELRGSGGFSGAAIVVRTRDELPRALRQQTTQVVIDNRVLTYAFLVVLSVQGIWLLQDIVSQAISLGYGVEFSYKTWTVGKTTEGKIVLTPAARTRGTAPEGGEE